MPSRMPYAANQDFKNTPSEESRSKYFSDEGRLKGSLSDRASRRRVNSAAPDDETLAINIPAQLQKALFLRPSGVEVTKGVRSSARSEGQAGSD